MTKGMKPGYIQYQYGMAHYALYYSNLAELVADLKILLDNCIEVERVTWKQVNQGAAEGSPPIGLFGGERVDLRD